MGRPQSLRTVAIHKLLDMYESEVVNEKKIAGPSAAIWTTLYEILDKNHRPSNPKAIYTAALKWLQSKTTPIENDSCVYEGNIVSILETTDDSHKTDDNINEIETQFPMIKFSIELSYKVWETISPIKKNYGRKRQGCVRSYFVLKPGVWTNVILDAVTKKRREIPCAWSFKTNKCYYSGNEFLTIRAKCNTCSAILCGVMEKEPCEPDPVSINFEVRGLDESCHDNEKTKSVRVGGAYANSLYGKQKPASVVRRDTLRKKASLFAKPYGRVPTANAIRCGKYRLREKEKISSCPYTALSYLKASSKYMNTIHLIAMDPFSVIYRSPDQVKLYKTYKRKNKFSEIACDATGSVVNKLSKIYGFYVSISRNL